MNQPDSSNNYSIENKVFDNAEFLFVVTPDGQQLIPVKVFADYFGISLKRANEIISRNRSLSDFEPVKSVFEQALPELEKLGEEQGFTILLTKGGDPAGEGVNHD